MLSFIDTNVLVYAEDRDSGEKRDRARDLLVELWGSQDGVISVQVLEEFFVTVTRKMPRKMPRKMSARKAGAIVEEYLAWKVVDNSAKLLRRAIQLHTSARLSLWNALIVEAALDAGCQRLYTEDLNAGQRFSSMIVVNPFL